ncbi:MAG: S49 family peptidase, partial [Elsteraceae bacterium]
GSYIASDTIWRSVKMARAAGKKVVASMGGVAASGGYFVAMAADQIVAEPATITGSIGVVGGKFVVSPLLEKLGVHVDNIETAPNAGFYSPTRSFTPDQRARFDEMLDRIYADFTSRVALDRKINPAKMDSLARGRVWTGAQAVELGLVDSLGGLEEAVAALRKLAELPDADEFPVVAYPPPEAPWKRLARGLQRMEEFGVLLDDAISLLGPSLAWMRRATANLSHGSVSLDFQAP